MRGGARTQQRLLYRPDFVWTEGSSFGLSAAGKLDRPPPPPAGPCPHASAHCRVTGRPANGGLHSEPLASFSHAPPFIEGGHQLQVDSGWLTSVDVQLGRISALSLVCSCFGRPPTCRWGCPPPCPCVPPPRLQVGFLRQEGKNTGPAAPSVPTARALGLEGAADPCPSQCGCPE